MKQRSGFSAGSSPSSLPRFSASLSVAIMTVVSLLVGGCTSKTVKDPTAPRSMIFPYGTYKHEIDVAFTPPGQVERKMHFSGVAKVNEDKISLVALSPMNTTVFRVTDDRKTDDVQTEVFIDSLKPMQSQMKQVYGLVKAMLTAPYEGGKPAVLNLKTEMGPAQIRFQEYDANKVPALVTVDNPRFKMQIHVTGYEI